MRLEVPREFVEHYFGSKTGYPFASQRRRQRTGVTHSGPIRRCTPDGSGVSRLACRFTESPLLLAAARLSFRAKSLLAVARIEPAGSGARWPKPAGRAMGIANQTSLSVTTVNRLYFGDNLGWLRNTKEFPDASPPPAIR